ALTTGTAIAAAALVALVSLVAAVTVLAGTNAQTKDALDRATEAKVKLADALASEQLTQYLQRVGLAQRDLAINNVGRAEELLHECARELRGWEWHLLKRQTREPERVVPIGGVWVIDVATSANGRYVATAGLSVPLLGEVKVRDAATGKEIHRLDGHFGPVI